VEKKVLQKGRRKQLGRGGQYSNEVIFRIFNLMNTVFPFKRKFHVIFCRNVMIYFDQQTKMELVNRFYEYTEPGGYLFIGHSESLNRMKPNTNM